jgi:hypothetical protein
LRQKILILLLMTFLSQAHGGIKDEFLVKWVDRRVSRVRVEPNRFLDQIGWADDIRHALELARGSQRPVFLFTHEGRINTGRC